jgi:hypothetical protein
MGIQLFRIVNGASLADGRVHILIKIPLKSRRRMVGNEKNEEISRGMKGGDGKELIARVYERFGYEEKKGWMRTDEAA